MGESVTLQRRVSKIEVKLLPLPTFSAFEKHVRTTFELNDVFVITDFDRESVVDHELYRSMRSGEYWKRHPKANRLFLVLDDISAPMDGDVELEVSYQPHFNTITKTGDANFSKIPHAVAELIDNSIQATNTNTGERRVEVEVELGGKGASFLVVRDNGRGMNASGLKDFATYFLTQENRGVSGPPLTPTFTGSPNGTTTSSSCNAIDQNGGGSNGAGGGGVFPATGKGKGRKRSGNFGRKRGRICSGFISKFGVGALQAGFYIGSCLTVVTKTVNQPDVYEFVMNEAEYERRAETNSAMFKDNIRLRNAGKGKEEGPEAERNGPSKELLDRLRAEEAGKSHFTYIVLTLRDHHVEWFSNNEKGSLKRELASIYHYYLHPDHCPDGIRREEDSSNELSAMEEEETLYNGGPIGNGSSICNGSGGGGSGAGDNGGPLEITYMQRTRSSQAVDRARLVKITDDFESRLNDARKDSFLFHMEILHPMQNPRLEQKRLPVTGVIHYYPYDGEKETRPRIRPDEEDDESTTIQAFWEGRLVPESHAAALSFFPQPRPKKKEREALGTMWKRRIKGMLFFDWHFPISNNKLRLQFMEGDLHAALNAKNIPPKHPAVMYPGSRGRQIEKDFRDWLVKCHESLDIEYRFDDKMLTPSNSKHEKWRKMTFGKGGATFMSDSRVKLPFLKPNVFGMINYFLTEVDEDEEEGRGQGQVSLQRCPEDVFGEDDSCAKLYPITEFDPHKSLMSDDDWNKAMVTFRKQMPARTCVVMTGTERPLPKKLTVRTGKAEGTKVSVQIFDDNKKAIVQIPQGKALRVHSILERPHPDGRGKLQNVLTVTAKPFTDKKYDKTYFFEAMTMKEPGDYKWTIAVVKEGVASSSKADRLLVINCGITVLPGNPTKMILEGDDWDKKISLGKLGNPCFLPAFSVKLRDASKCVCPLRSFKSVTVSCVEAGALDLVHSSSKTSTHEIGRVTREDVGLLEYDEHSWKLVPKQTALLSAEEYTTRSMGFEVAVVAHMQQDRQQDADEKVFKSTLELVFEPGAPAELVLLLPGAEAGVDGSPVATVEAGSELPELSFGAMDAGGNRTAPFQNETWQVSLDITAAAQGSAEEEGPDFVGSMTEQVAAGAATFKGPVVKWSKPLRQEGEVAVVDATLSIGTGSRDKKEVASTSLTVRVKPSKNPVRAVVCLDGNPWPTPGEAKRAAAGAAALVGTGAAKAADAVGVSRPYLAGSVISGLHIRLYDQGGVEVAVGKDTFEASNKEAVTCSWDPAWHWPGGGAAGGQEFDRLPDLKVPTQLSRLNSGIHHAKVVVTPKAKDGWATTLLPASFAFSVHAGPVARWMAVSADTGKISENPGPLVMAAGSSDPKLCQASFVKVVKGFLPVDEYGNLVKTVPRAPEIGIEGMPETTLFPVHQCKLAKATKPGGLYQFPRSLNLVGPPCEGGHLLIMSPRLSSGENGGAAAAAKSLPVRGSLASGRGGRSNGTGDSVTAMATAHVLRLAVSVKAGPPVKVLIRSPKLGAEEFSSEIRATLLAGLKVTDLEVCLVDAGGNKASLPTRGAKITVKPRDPPYSHKKSPGKKNLAKRATHDPSLVMPHFVLDLKLQESPRSPQLVGDSARAAAAERAATVAKEGVALSVGAEGQGLEGVQEACIHWTRLRTSAVTKVHLATLFSPPAAITTATATRGKTSSLGGAGAREAGAAAVVLEELVLLSAVIGQRARRSGVVRPVDGPLPTLVVWVDTDNNVPFTPPLESITFAITTSGASGTRTLNDLYENSVPVPTTIDRPNALMFKPKEGIMEQDIGDHNIICTYVERRALSSQGSQGEAEDQVEDITLRVVAGRPFQLVPMKDDANLLNSLSASNQVSMSPDDEVARNARRLVEKTFRFAANDCKGNMASQINGPVRMRIVKLDGVNVPASEMPRLEESNNDGYVEADPTATGVFLFEENWLQAGVGTREGDYKLVVDSAGDPELQSWTTTFRFETDERRLDSIREVEARLRPLQHKMVRFDAAVSGTRAAKDTARRHVENAISELPQSLTSQIDVNSQDYAASIQEAKRLLATFEAEQSDRQAYRARPLKFESGRMQPQDEQKINPIGYVAELGYVEDEYLAKLLSHKAGSKLKAVYVDTKAQLDMVRQARAGGFCRETVAVFKVPGENRQRNLIEMAQKKLPLRKIKERGFIDYLVNTIQLPDRNEDLRDTLFSALYGSMVLFDTHNNAHEYQKKCKRSGNMPLPILVHEDGASLERNGYVPPARDPGSLNRLKIVYGAMPANLTPEYAKTEQYTRKLRDLIPALQDLLTAEEDMSNIHRDHNVLEWQQEIAVMTQELNALMARRAGGSGSGGGSSRRRKITGGAATKSGRRSGGGGGDGGVVGVATTASSGKRSSSNGVVKGNKRQKVAEVTPRGRSGKRTRR